MSANMPSNPANEVAGIYTPSGDDVLLSLPPLGEGVRDALKNVATGQATNDERIRVDRLAILGQTCLEFPITLALFNIHPPLTGEAIAVSILLYY
jgi:hypothetical protein